MVYDWKTDVERWPRALPVFSYEPKTTALLIIDMQNFCANPKCGLGLVLKAKYPDMFKYYRERMNIVLENNIKLLTFFRQNKMRVVYLTMGPALPDGSDYFTPRRERDLELQQRSGVKTNFHQGTFEHSILPDLRPIEGELVINKTSMGAFNSTGIDFTLRKMKVESLVITGVVTNACVQTTAVDAADRWYKCILVEDACGSFSEEAHYAAVKNYARLCGMVKETNAVIDYLRGKLSKMTQI